MKPTMIKAYPTISGYLGRVILFHEMISVEHVISVNFCDDYMPNEYDNGSILKLLMSPDTPIECLGSELAVGIVPYPVMSKDNLVVEMYDCEEYKRISNTCSDMILLTYVRRRKIDRSDLANYWHTYYNSRETKDKLTTVGGIYNG